MFPQIISIACWLAVALIALPAAVQAQQPPYDVFPPADPPWFRVRYEASSQSGELVYAVNYTIWIPNDVETLRGLIVHQHGCGEGSCRSGLTGAYDLHWQALARKHDCALLSPSYEQPDQADCQMWCDPRNGSDTAFQQALVDLGAKSGHPELASVPWALWGHSGGGHWAGGMVMLHPERVAAAWLRSGVPLLKPNPDRATIKSHTLSDAALQVPLMCNLGTKEGVTVTEGRFASVWPANEVFFNEVRSRGGLIGVAVDPLTAHECGNQRYFAIPWLDSCLSTRLAKISAGSLNAMPTEESWLAPVTGLKAVPAAMFEGDPMKAAWLPNETIARAWMQYVKDTEISDLTPPSAPIRLRLEGNELQWEAEADLESGIAHFIIERDGQFLANVPEQLKNPFGRPLFQGLQYSDTPTQPLVPLAFTDTTAEPGIKHTYRVISVNTVGLKSKPSADASARITAAYERRSAGLIGYTEGRNDLPEGQFANWVTNRAVIVRADGSERQVLAEVLTQKQHSWTQFAGWSPDGRYAIIGSHWESPENAAWERQHGTFRMTEGWLSDTCLLDMTSGRITNLTAVERISSYNTGLFFLPDGKGCGFTPLINGISRPYVMDLDGGNKRAVSGSGDGFAYGYSASPDGKWISFHENYQIFVARADGSEKRRIETGNPFNFVPLWSPDGERILFVSGEHYNCHPHVVRNDGSGLTKLADRGGYRGVVERLKYPDFHSESSDVPVWSADGKSVYYTAMVGESIELMRVTLNGNVQQLTISAPGVRHYHPSPSPDGHWVLFGSDRSGVMQLYVARSDGTEAQPVTDVPAGFCAMHGHWQPSRTVKH